MKKVQLPCEILRWNVIPAIRREISLILIKEHRLNQREVAGLLGVSEACVSHYLKNRRGNMIKLGESDRERLRKIAKRIKREKDEREIAKLLCKACRHIGRKVLKGA